MQQKCAHGCIEEELESLPEDDERVFRAACSDKDKVKSEGRIFGPYVSYTNQFILEGPGYAASPMSVKPGTRLALAYDYE